MLAHTCTYNMILFCTYTTHSLTHIHTHIPHTHTCTRTHTNTHAHTHTQTNIFTQFSGANPEKLVVKTRHFLESKGAYSPGKGHRCELGEGGEGRVRVASYPGHVVRGKSGLREKTHDFMGYCKPSFTNR